MKLQTGNKAPDFTAGTDGGGSVKLSDKLGKWIVLYFYPKDNTPGCTKEACDFRDNMEYLTSLNVEVVGISKDSAKSHDNFKAKHNLNFVLASDPETKIIQAYDSWKEKKMYGKSYMGTQRNTFIIDNEGIIRFIYTNVKVTGHVDEIKKKLDELMK